MPTTFDHVLGKFTKQNDNRFYNICCHIHTVHSILCDHLKPWIWISIHIYYMRFYTKSRMIFHGSASSSKIAELLVQLLSILTKKKVMNALIWVLQVSIKPLNFQNYSINEAMMQPYPSSCSSSLNIVSSPGRGSILLLMPMSTEPEFNKRSCGPSNLSVVDRLSSVFQLSRFS